MSDERDPPEIPDHQVLAIIGRGACGEVWLARSLTGSMRAIKVVWREDFETGGAFEREFDGITQYEPFSRKHPGLVDILQVGRNDERRFYYCVMELADDASRRERRPETDSDDVEPRNSKIGAATALLKQKVSWDKPDQMEADETVADSSDESEADATATSQDRPIDPETYRSDILSQRIREDGAAAIQDVVEHGAELARGIGFLHENGLIHRDIKPGNVIFINGKAKMADVGLVTAVGDQSFVGTEGFVPPEGPGTAAADLFSLGMVLYEMSTGKDRLDFPDLPSVLPEGEDRIIWRRVNRAICRACATRAESRYKTGEQMALVLEGQVTEETPLFSRVWLYAAAAVVGLGIILAILANSGRGDKLETTNKPSDDPTSPLIAAGGNSTTIPLENRTGQDASPMFGVSEISPNPSEVVSPEVAEFRTLEINTQPSGADVFHGEQWLGTTPVFIDPAPSNSVSYNIRLEGHRIETIDYLGAGDDRGTIDLELESWRFPQAGMRWVNGNGMTFRPTRERHLSTSPIRADSMVDFAREVRYPLGGETVAARLIDGSETYVSAMTYKDARAYCSWLSSRDRSQGILLPEQFYRPVLADLEQFGIPPTIRQIKSSNGLLGAYLVEVDQIRYGSVLIESDPPGASIFRDGIEVGTTPLEMPRIRTGQVEFEIRLRDHKTIFLATTVQDGDLEELFASLERGKGVDFQSPWENSLEMLFLPSGSILVSAFETRRKDFAAFLANGKNTENIRHSSGLTDPLDRPLFPVDRVSRADAMAFCDWLTRHERRLGFISSRHVYRLPSDIEWSEFAGLPPERGRDPANRSGQFRGSYPWGFEWPPPSGVGNFADIVAAEASGDSLENFPHIENYSDGYALAAPVDIPRPDPRGLYHVAGNVAEWVSNNYGGNAPDLMRSGVVRGGTFRDHLPSQLSASARWPVAPDSRTGEIGFRVVLAIEN